MPSLSFPNLPNPACWGEDPDLFFGKHVCGAECDGTQGCMTGKSEQGRFGRITRAKSVCRRCEDALECLTWALDTDQKFGVWGGMTERERTKVRKDRRGQ